MIKLINLSKVFPETDTNVTALTNINLEIQKGDFVAIVGPSGSGKSTLLNLIGGILTPTEGQIEIDNENISKLADEKRAKFRANSIGFVFQNFNLVSHLSVLENVAIPALFNKQKKFSQTGAKKRAKEILKALSLETLQNRTPEKISGGQKQRVAIARALVNRPKIILADEPTGNLDGLTAKKTMALLKKIHQVEKNTIIIATHDKEIADYADTVIYIKDGKVTSSKNYKSLLK